MDLKTKSIGLVLLEEFKGLAHAGVLKFLEEQKIKPNK
jgi:NTE family protein